MRRLALISVLLVLWCATALAQSSPAGSAAPAWSKTEEFKRTGVVDFNDVCKSSALNPVNGANTDWMNPCRTVNATELKDVIIGNDLPSSGLGLRGAYVVGPLESFQIA